MGNQWYEDWFADKRYLALYQHRNNEEASSILDLIEKVTGITKDSAILDLACGAGRHSINLAKRGYKNITAIDLSPTLINEGKRNAEADGVKINFQQQDMRFFKGNYDLIINLFTSFGYFQSDEENEKVILRVGECLKTGGYLILDFFNSFIVRRDIIARNEKILPSDEHVELLRTITSDRIEKKIIIRSADTVKEFYESVRLFELSDFERMFTNAGIVIKKTFGNYNGLPFEVGSSQRLILVGKKDG